MVLLLKMLTGSRLYGTARPDSDYDWYEVYDHIKPQHKIVDGDDVQRWPLSLFMKISDKGGHNALDLMFADRGWPVVDLLWPLRASYVANPYLTEVRHMATVQAMRERGDDKSLMHAQRLLDNLSSVWQSGRYNPRWEGAEQWRRQTLSRSESLSR